MHPCSQRPTWNAITDLARSSTSSTLVPETPSARPVCSYRLACDGCRWELVAGDRILPGTNETAWRGRRPGGFAPAPCQPWERARRSGHSEVERRPMVAGHVPSCSTSSGSARLCTQLGCAESDGPYPRFAFSYVLSYPPPDVST
jgi:hypothetical protein